MRKLENVQIRKCKIYNVKCKTKRAIYKPAFCPVRATSGNLT